MVTFYLGTHMPSWLSHAGIPLFVSRRTLGRYKTLPRAAAPWALDSGGFTELNMFGGWRTSPQQYADEATRFAAEVGRLDWAAIQDWMCEPVVLKKTGRTVADHQRMTIESYLTLRGIAPEVPWAPVVQGYAVGEYVRHVDLYRDHGVDLASLPVVGVGSVCRRQASDEIATLFRELHALGLRCHGFGLKTLGLRKAARYVASADSLAWSLDGRYSPPLPGCVGHKNCANCLRFALLWRGKVLGAITEGLAA